MVFEDDDDDDDDDDPIATASVVVHRDFSGPDYELKPDHSARPLWIYEEDQGRGAARILLETHSPYFKQAQDFLVAIAEPVNRPRMIHEYKLTAHSLYAAVSIGLDTEKIVSRLSLLSKTSLPKAIENYIRDNTANVGKILFVLRRKEYFLETRDKDLSDPQ